MTSRATIAVIARMLAKHENGEHYEGYESTHRELAERIDDALRTPPPDHAALVQALLAACDRLGMANIPADAPAAFARVLGEFGAGAPEDAEILKLIEQFKGWSSGMFDDQRMVGLPVQLKADCARVAAIIARHLPSDRYGEGFAAGVEAAAKEADDYVNEYNSKNHRVFYDEMKDLAHDIRTLTPHGDDHG